MMFSEVPSVKEWSILTMKYNVFPFRTKNKSFGAGSRSNGTNSFEIFVNSSSIFWSVRKVGVENVEACEIFSSTILLRRFGWRATQVFQAVMACSVHNSVFKSHIQRDTAVTLLEIALVEWWIIIIFLNIDKHYL